MKVEVIWAYRLRIEENYAGRRAMVMKVQGRRKRGKPKRRWLDKVKDDIKEKGLSAAEVYDRATRRVCHGTSTPHKSGVVKTKEKKKILLAFGRTREVGVCSRNVVSRSFSHFPVHVDTYENPYGNVRLKLIRVPR